MSASTNPQDLTSALLSLQSSLYVLSTIYQSYIKLFVLLVLIYFFYKLGNLTIRDQILRKKNNLVELIQKKSQISTKIPNKIKRISKINKSIIVISILVLLSIIIAHYTKYIRIVKYQMLLIGIVYLFVFIILIILTIYKYYLNRKIIKVNSLDRIIQFQRNNFQKSLGNKVIAILKNHLCKDKITKYNTSGIGANQCQKLDCKEIRTLYKSRNQAIQSLIEETLNFQWCSVCKKKQHFDQLLPFEFKQYHAKSQTQEQQVKERTTYLIEGLQKMREWVKHTNPCNCSKLYWNLSTKLILNYKKIKKLIKKNQINIRKIQKMIIFIKFFRPFIFMFLSYLFTQLMNETQKQLVLKLLLINKKINKLFVRFYKTLQFKINIIFFLFLIIFHYKLCFLIIFSIVLVLLSDDSKIKFKPFFQFLSQCFKKLKK